MFASSDMFCVSILEIFFIFNYLKTEFFLATTIELIEEIKILDYSFEEQNLCICKIK